MREYHNISVILLQSERQGLAMLHEVKEHIELCSVQITSCTTCVRFLRPSGTGESPRRALNDFMLLI